MKCGPGLRGAAPVGTGPFKFVQWDRGQRVVLEKNPSYWRFPVKVDRVVFRPIVEDQARLTELLTGALDLIVGTPPDFVAQLESNPKVTLQQAGRRARLVPRHQQPEEALRRQARAPGAELRGQQGRDRPRRAQGHRGRLARARCCPAPGAPTAASSRIPTIPSGRRSSSPRPASRTASPPRCGCPSRARACSRRWPCRTIIQSNLKAVGVNVDAPDHGVGRVSSPSCAPRSRTCSRSRGWPATRTPTW